ncbi:MAG: glycosyltransferase [Planctomycetota bacterium]
MTARLVPEPIAPSRSDSSLRQDFAAIDFRDTAVGRPLAEQDGLPPVLVVTPSFNQAPFLETTLRSVLLQNYPHLRYVVVDGGSTDGSREILEHYRESIDELIIEPDEGQSDAIIKGIGGSNEGWFCWINSDDFLMPGVVAKLVDEAGDDTDLWTCDVRVIGDTAPYVMQNRNLDAAAILREDRYSFAQPGLWFRLPRLLASGGIRKDFQFGFDWDLLVRYLSDNARVQRSDFVGASFRVHPSSKTSVEQEKSLQANHFEQEHHGLRKRLESELPPRLAAASRLGRRRRPWNQFLVQQLDDWQTSPLRLAMRVAGGSLSDPGARWSPRTAGAIIRLLSRYVRPGWRDRKRIPGQ